MENKKRTENERWKQYVTKKEAEISRASRIRQNAKVVREASDLEIRLTANGGVFFSEKRISRRYNDRNCYDDKKLIENDEVYRALSETMYETMGINTRHYMDLIATRRISRRKYSKLQKIVARRLWKNDFIGAVDEFYNNDCERLSAKYKKQKFKESLKKVKGGI